MQLEGLESKTAHRIVADRNTNGEYQLKISSIAFRGNRRDPNLDFHRCLPFYNQNKKSIARHRQMILVNYKPEPEFNVASRTSKEYTSRIRTFSFEDAFDERTTQFSSLLYPI
jgi:DNA polymerase-3 subunit alpha/error-prone DNA polymerase